MILRVLMDRRRHTFTVESNRELRRSTGCVFARVVLLGRVLCFMFVLFLSVPLRKKFVLQNFKLTCR